MNISYDFKKTYYTSTVGRTLIVNSLSESELELLSNIDEIEIIDNIKYLDGTELRSSMFDHGNNKASILLMPLLNENDVTIDVGRSLKNENEIICPSLFYPNDIYTSEYDEIENIYNRKYAIKNIISYENITFDMNDNITFKVVGQYKNNPLETINTCYISKSDYDKIANDFVTCSSNEDGTEECQVNNSMFIRVKLYDDLEKVENILDSNNIIYRIYYTIDEGTLQSLTYIPMFISMIVIIILMVILMFWIRKKNINNQESTALYMLLGFKNKDIKKIVSLETLTLLIISIILSSIVYFIIYKLYTEIYLIEFIYNNYYIKIPYILIGILTIFIIIYIILLDLIYLKKSTKTSINILYKDGD
jgi:hypothetical protein